MVYYTKFRVAIFIATWQWISSLGNFPLPLKIRSKLCGYENCSTEICIVNHVTIEIAIPRVAISVAIRFVLSSATKIASFFLCNKNLDLK